MPNESCFMYLDVCKLCSNLMEKVVALKKNSLFGILHITNCVSPLIQMYVTKVNLAKPSCG
jgi:hypothetical protein